MSTLKEKPTAKTRVFWIALYYFAVLAAVIYLHGRGGLATPPFIYQGF